MRYGISKDHRLSGPLDFGSGHCRNPVPVIERPRDPCVGWEGYRAPISAKITTNIAVPIRSGRLAFAIRSRSHAPPGTTPEGIIKKLVSGECTIADLVLLGDIGREKLKPEGLGVIEGVVAKEGEFVAIVAFVHDRRIP